MKKDLDLEDLICEMEDCISLTIGLAIAQGNELENMHPEHIERALYSLGKHLERIVQDVKDYDKQQLKR